jgi:hypothetical protein
MVTKIICCVFFSVSSLVVFCQNNGELPIRKNAFSLNIAGITPLVGFSYERLIKQKVCLETGLGLFSYGFGISYLPPKISRGQLHPYLGLKFSAFALPDVGNHKYFYLPLGVNYITAYQMQIGFDIGPSIDRHLGGEYGVFNKVFPYNSVGVYGNVKIGLRF